METVSKASPILVGKILDSESAPRSGERMAKSKAQWRMEHKALNLCTHCNEAVIPGQTLCPTHSARSAERRRASALKRAEMVKRGLCVICGQCAVKGRRHCHQHTALAQARLEAKLLWSLRRTEKGICRQCSQPAAPDRTLCLPHLITERRAKAIKTHI